MEVVEKGGKKDGRGKDREEGRKGDFGVEVWDGGGLETSC